MYYYVLIVMNDIEPVLHGPYHSAKLRDKRTLVLREAHGLDHGIYPLDSPCNGVEVNTYSGEYMERIYGRNI